MFRLVPGLGATLARARSTAAPAHAPALGAAAAALRELDVRGVAAWAERTLRLDAEDVALLAAQKVDGAALLGLAEDDELRRLGLSAGPASAVARAVNAALAVELVVYPPPGRGAANNPVRMIMTPARFPRVFPLDAPLLLVRNGAVLRKLYSLEEALEALAAADAVDTAGAAPISGRARLCASRSDGAELADAKGFIKNASTALELATTHALTRDEGLARAFGGRLVAVNEGELVQLSLAARGQPAVLLEADGLVAAPASDTLLLNSVKFTPGEEDVDGVLADAAKLQLMLANLGAVSTRPPGAKEQLRGLSRVAPFLSGSNFSARVEAICRASGVGSVTSNGEGFAVTPPALN